MKKLFITLLALGTLATIACTKPADQTTPADDTANTPPARTKASYAEPPVAPASTGPVTEPAKKKGHGVIQSKR